MNIEAIRGGRVSAALDMLMTDVLPQAIVAGLMPPLIPGETLETRDPKYLIRVFQHFHTDGIDAPLPHHIGMAGALLHISEETRLEAPDRPLDEVDQLAVNAVQLVWFLYGMVVGGDRINERRTAAASEARRTLGRKKHEKVIKLAPKFSAHSKRAAAMAIAAETAFDHEQVRRILMKHFPGPLWPPTTQGEPDGLSDESPIDD